MVAALAVLAGLGLLPGAASAAAADDPASPRLVVVGAPGLSWSDLDGGDLPALDAMVEEGAVGSLTVRAVRSRACAIDGWLTLSAGRRAADRPGPCRAAAARRRRGRAALGRVRRGRGRGLVRRAPRHAR